MADSLFDFEPRPIGFTNPKRSKRKYQEALAEGEKLLDKLAEAADIPRHLLDGPPAGLLSHPNKNDITHDGWTWDDTLDAMAVARKATKDQR